MPSIESTGSAPLGERVQFETLLSDISARVVVATSDQLSAVIQSSLDAVRVFFDADRCGLLAVSGDGMRITVAFASYAEGISGPESSINLAERFPWGRQRLVVERKPLIVSNLADLPPEAARDRESFEATPTRSSLIIPLVSGSELLHLIVVAMVRNQVEWPRDYVPRLRLLGEVLVNAIEQDRASARDREHAARMAAAVDAAALGFAEWSPETDQVFIDDRLHDLLGIEQSEKQVSRALWLSRTDPAAHEVMTNNHQRLVAGDVDRTTAEYRYRHPARGAIWLRHASRRIEDRQAVRIVEAIEDVTEHRQALEDVKKLRERLENENRYLRQEAQRVRGQSPIVGRSDAISRALALAERVAATDSTVLLFGETGCGKERFATFIHENSRRGDRPMIRVNCAAIPIPLIESELFGREKGAYTGALSKQMGRFELASGSTLFLDEVGDLPPEIQVKLLRAIENRTIERLGNPRPIAVDVRIIAATNHDLARDVREGRFREDLYYRLRVFPIRVPPLRERRDDIPLLVEAFIDELGVTVGKRISGVDPSCLEAMAAYPWPGNIRELRNVVEHAMIMANEPVLRIERPEFEAGDVAAVTDGKDAERARILDVLNATGWRIRGAHGAASRLGLKPTTLESRMKKLGLNRPGT